MASMGKLTNTEKREVAEGARRIVGAENVLVNEPMARHTTFAIGGPADVMVEPCTIDQVRGIVELCRKMDIELRVLGCGSDLLVADAGIGGVVMKLAEGLSRIEVSGSEMRVQAGATNAAVAAAACEAGLTGYEFASGIPGTVGGAAIMNAGAYGGEFKDVAVKTVCLDDGANEIELAAHEAAWSYRHSRMDEEGLIVLEVVLSLSYDEPSAIQDRMDDLAERRATKQPLDLPSAGSTFKRPTGFFAGKLIQDAGLRGLCVGDAQVSTKHTGFVVNNGCATAADVRGLIAEVQRRVFEHEGVQLEPEVRMWGFEQQ